ncbi:MAG: sigma-70 family RNA polymerase sigma factor, partial [Clostridia bacterium]|nr:sigma-70 family RNA polymerase sigma factor [Clostridia bacterium]
DGAMNSELKNAEDALLVERYRAGDEEAFEVLYDRYKTRIKAISHPYFLLWGDREDVVEEGVIGFVYAVNTFSRAGGASFRTYATTCIKAKISTAIKRSMTDGNVALNKAKGYDAADETTFDPEYVVLMKETIDNITGGLDGELSAFETEVLKKYLEGFGYDQISAQTGKNYKAVDNALQRAKKKIAERYEENN